MQKKFVFFYILLFSVLLAESDEKEIYNYVVNYFMMPSLNMKMEISHNFSEPDSARIDVFTKTKPFFNKIFAVDNHYFSIYNESDKRVKFHKKTISQPNVTQTLSINYENSPIVYSTGETRESKTPTYDFFSMLMFLRAVPRDSLEFIKITVDMEGEFFQATFNIEAEDRLKLGKEKIKTDRIKINYTKIDKQQLSVLDYTDIFFWKIASESGNKYIWLEKNNKRRIIKAKFSENSSWLEAKLIE